MILERSAQVLNKGEPLNIYKKVFNNGIVGRGAENEQQLCAKAGGGSGNRHHGGRLDPDLRRLVPDGPQLVAGDGHGGGRDDHLELRRQESGVRSQESGSLAP